MNKEERERMKEDMRLWMAMSQIEKIKWNGFFGWCNRLKYAESSVFLPEKTRKENKKDKWGDEI